MHEKFSKFKALLQTVKKNYTITVKILTCSLVEHATSNLFVKQTRKIVANLLHKAIALTSPASWRYPQGNSFLFVLAAFWSIINAFSFSPAVTKYLTDSGSHQNDKMIKKLKNKNCKISRCTFLSQTAYCSFPVSICEEVSTAFPFLFLCNLSIRFVATGI